LKETAYYCAAVITD